MPLFAQATETVFRLGRIQENSDWFWPGVVGILLVWYVIYRYRRDAADLKFWQRLFLTTLRIGVLLALFGYYLNPRWERLVGSSRVAVLIDTSASMAGRDLFTGVEKPVVPSDDEPDTTPAAGPTRLEAATDWMERSDLIGRLREKHDVVVYRFDRSLERLSLEEHFKEAEELRHSTPPHEAPAPPTGALASLQAEGEQTRLGESLNELLQRERGEPLSGVIVISDGGQNAGSGTDAALETAGKSNLPIFTLGIGALRQPLNFRAVSIDTADRAFPGDPFLVRTQVEMLGGEEAGNAAVRLPVELYLRHGGEGGNEIKLGEKVVELQPGGSAIAEFEIHSEEIGKHRLVLRIVPPPEDTNDADNVTEAELEIVDRKDRILLYAGGPARDYQFLLAQIARDKNMQVDIYLPWASSGVSQSADEQLTHFPDNAADMAKYDCVVAFDPNWSELGDVEINMLEHWVARQGGGLIVVGGPIHLGDSITGWTTDPKTAKIRDMYPVELFAKLAVAEQRYYAQSQPMPLKFTRAGEEVEYLRPADGDAESRGIWSEFPGFYAFSNVRGIKPTATLLAEIDTTALGISGTAAIFVEQFYGAGHVLYLGSGEIWRLRRLDPGFFEKLYTKMIRHVAQGRLQRESDRGSPATDKRRYSLGSIATLRATANDEQLQPLTIPKLPVEIRTPSGKPLLQELMLDPTVPGSYLGHLPMTEEGAWKIAMLLPGSTERIERTVQVRMSDLERENPSRNEPLLRMLAEKSGGRYYASLGLAAAPLRESGLYGGLFLQDRRNEADPPPELFDLLKIRSQRAVLDSETEKSMTTIFLYILCSLLFIEWTFRRLFRLA